MRKELLVRSNDVKEDSLRFGPTYFSLHENSDDGVSLRATVKARTNLGKTSYLMHIFRLMRFDPTGRLTISNSGLNSAGFRKPYSVEKL